MGNFFDGLLVLEAVALCNADQPRGVGVQLGVRFLNLDGARHDVGHGDAQHHSKQNQAVLYDRSSNHLWQLADWKSGEVERFCARTEPQMERILTGFPGAGYRFRAES